MNVHPYREILFNGQKGKVDHEYCKNELYLCQYSIRFFILQSLLNLYSQPSYLYFFFQALLDILFKNSYILFSLLVLLTVFFYFSEIKSNMSPMITAQKLNQIEHKVWNGTEFINIKSKDLEVGHIIKCTSRIPADLIILASDSNLIQAQTYLENNEEKQVHSILKSIITYENSEFVGLARLYGVAEVEESNSKFCEMTGKIKIKGKPNSIKIDKNHFLLQGSTISTTILGLVVYTGQDTKLARTLTNTFKNSQITKKLNKKSWIFLLVLALLIIFSTVPASIQLQEFSLDESLIYFFLLYNNILPISLFVLLEILRLYNWFYIRKNLNFSDISGFTQLENLGKVEYVTIDEPLLSSSPILCKYVNGDEVQEVYEERDQGTLVTDRSFNLTFCKYEVNYDLWSLIILSTSVTAKDSETLQGNKNEICIIKAAEQLGFSLNYKNSALCSITSTGRTQEYQVIGTSVIEHRTRTIISQRDFGYFLVLGQGPSVNPLLSESDAYKSDDFTSEFFSKGLLPYTLAYKKLTSGKLLKLSDKIEEISSSRIDQSKKFKRIFNKLEDDLTYLTTLGVDCQVTDEKTKCIQDLIDMKLKVFVVSTGDRFRAEGLMNSLEFSNVFSLIGIDSEANCYRSLQKAILKKLYKDEDKRDELRAETFKDFDESPKVKPSRYTNTEKIIVNHRIFRKFTIKNNLEFLDREFNWKKQVTLLVDRDSFRLCIKNQVTLKMFIALLAAAKAAYFYGMHPDDKVALINLIQTNIKHRPGVLALCKDFWSLGMAQNACSSGSTEGGLNCDFINVKFVDLPEVIRQFRALRYIEKHAVSWSFYKNLVEVLIQFLFQFYQSFSAQAVWGIDFAVFYNIITSIQLISRRTFEISAVKVVLIAFVQIVFILCFLVVPMKYAVLFRGSAENFEVFSQVLFITVVSSILLVCFYRTRSIAALLASVGLLVLVSNLFMDINPYGSGFYWVEVCFSVLAISVPGLFFSSFKSSPSKYPNLASVHRESDLFTGDRDIFNRKKYTLRFRNKRTEINFRNFYTKEIFKTIRATIGALFTIFLIWTISLIILKDTKTAIAARIILTSLYLIFFAFSFTSYFENNSSFVITIILLFSIFIKNYIEFAQGSLSIISTLLIPPVSFILLSVDWLVVSYINILAYLLNIVTVSIFFNATHDIEIFYLIVLITFMYLASAVVGYEIEMHHRDVFVLTHQIKTQVENTQSVLEILLPEFVIARVKAGVRYIAEDRGKVTVIFCDICDFEQLSSDYSPKEFCSLLDSIFTLFDQLCEDFGVTKIETVGKTYMACCGLNKISESDQPPARLACDLALAILRECENIQLKKGFLQVKIGINTGPVTAGVVGFHKPQFSLVGDTVNTASRMCSTLSKKNSIQISMETYENLTNYSGLSFESNKIEAKGKGEMETFIVTRSKELKVFPLRMRTSLMSPQKQTNWRESVMSREDTELIPSIWNLKTRSTQRQRDYLMKKIESKSTGIKSFLLLTFGNYLILFICDSTRPLSNLFIIFELVTKVTVFISAWILFVLHSRFYKKLGFYYLTFSIYLIAFTSSILSIHSKDRNVFIVEVCTIILLINHAQNIQMICSIFLNLVLISLYMLSSYLILSLTIQEALLLIFFSLINLFAINRIESNFQKSFNLKVRSDKEIRVTENLLVQMMPAHVVYQLSEGSSVTDQLFDVTILYADIVGFTAWSSGKSPIEVVQMLSNLFTEFDKKCVDLGVYKVHTIGDCYVVLGYLTGKRDPDGECLNVLIMAQNMIRIIQEENEAYHMQLAMRIGIHTGSLIAGVIGNNVVRYDIWGKDVLVANKMESCGQSGRINVSEVTKKFLENSERQFEFEFNKEVQGFKSYFVSEKGQ